MATAAPLGATDAPREGFVASDWLAQVEIPEEEVQDQPVDIIEATSGEAEVGDESGEAPEEATDSGGESGTTVESDTAPAASEDAGTGVPDQGAPEGAEAVGDAATAEEGTGDTRFPGRPDAPEMTTDDLWDAYSQTQGRFEGFLAETENLDPATTTGSRVYSQTIQTGVELRDLLEELVSREDELSEQELQVGTDSLLTIDQVIGSLFVEIGECQRGKDKLGTLLDDPRVVERPVLQQSAQRWYNNAVRCVERQRVEAEIAEARRQGHREKIADLERELSDAEQAEAEADASVPQDGDDEDSILLSRSELMEVLRTSQLQRDQTYAGYSGPIYQGPKKEFGLAVFGAAIGVPAFALDWIFDEHANTWSDGGNFNVGFEFFVRKRRRSQHGFTFTYADLHTEDHWWIRKNKKRSDAKWVNNDLAPIGLTYRYEAIAPVDKKDRVQIYFGLDFGINIIPSGQWTEQEVTNLSTECFPGGEAEAGAKEGGLDVFRSGGSCGPDRAAAEAGNDNLPSPIFGDNRVKDTLPPVLPSIGLGIGFRYMISDLVGIGIEAGWRDFYGYAGGRLEFIIAKKKSDYQRAMERRQEEEAIRQAQNPTP